jgi:hypothetical protein
MKSNILAKGLYESSLLSIFDPKIDCLRRKEENA